MRPRSPPSPEAHPPQQHASRVRGPGQHMALRVATGLRGVTSQAWREAVGATHTHPRTVCRSRASRPGPRPRHADAGVTVRIEGPQNLRCPKLTLLSSGQAAGSLLCVLYLELDFAERGSD